MNAIKTLAALFVAMSAGHAMAQTPPAAAPPAKATVLAVLKISPDTTYEDALTCYQFHGVSKSIAEAMGKRANLSENQKTEYANAAKKSGYMQQMWFQRLGEVNGDKKPAEMNADLQRVAGGVVTDANAGLGGDKEALARNEAVREKCHGFEKLEAAPAAPAPGAKPAKPG
ncbi:MAG TPA: hypothetical protein VG942_16845 [Hyphomonadaceae bacterium]|nr:hypothetical protein [Hyphomonadaceae bacterium]